MKLFPLGVLATLAAACAQTQGPLVVTVPPDEMSKPPRPEQSAVPASLATPPVPAPAAAAPKDSYNRCNVAGLYIAISFDDGPHPELTPKLLDILKARGVKATFYLIGKNAAAHPEIVRRIKEEGHELGNHSWTHTAFTKLSPAKIAAELNDTSAAIAQAAGEPPKTFRPPYGATNTTINRRIAGEFKMPVILWSVDPQDWKYRNAARVASHIIEKTTPGDIILAHDIHPSTVAAMPQALDALLAKGFKFVTVSELIAMDRPVEVVKHPVGATPPPN